MRFRSRAFAAALSAAALFATRAEAEPLPLPSYDLAEPGDPVVDFSRYGEFRNPGTPEYVYELKDKEGLAAAMGEGLYPNESLGKNPAYAAFRERRGSTDPWKFSAETPRDDFYHWATAPGIDDGARLYYTAEALRRGGHVRHALKAYHAVVVLHPRSVIWSADGSFYWYVAPEAIARAQKLCSTYPELGLQLEGAFADVRRSPENKPEADAVAVWPGAFVPARLERIDPATLPVTATRGEGRVRLEKRGDRHWRLLVDGKPFFVKGFTYTCTTVGESAHALNLRSWMTLDDDKNGRNDGMFDSWIDADKDGEQGENERAVGDAALLRDMGANAIRVYHGVDAWGNYQPEEYDKPLMRKLNRDYGIFFVMGDFIGAYTVGSQARWDVGTDYTDPEQCARMKAVVRAMVLDHKDEPYVLFWLLGNENQHPHTHTNAHEHPEAYAAFLNDTARMIKELDPDHPVAVCNLNFQGLAALGKYAAEIDIYGANVYAGAYSMGSVWHLARRYYDRPVLITEMGCDAYAEGRGPDEEAQAEYFRQNWEDIELNAAGNTGQGNAIGGLVFEWMDEWWKSSRGDSWGDPSDHNTAGDMQNPFPDRWSHEEWLGVFGQGDGRKSHFLREPRKVCDAIRHAWSPTSAEQAGLPVRQAGSAHEKIEV